jgi:Tol biopolymer transport system component
MTMDQTSRADRVLVRLIDELASAQTPDYLEAAIERASDRPQRPTWTFPERWFLVAEITSRSASMPRLPWRAIATALVILALLVGAAAIYVGTHQTRLPAPFGPAANGLIPYSSDGDLYLGDPVTGQTRLLLDGQATDWGPSFSYDGTQVAFIRDVPSSSGEHLGDIYVIRSDGSGLHKITPEPIRDLVWAQWSPDRRVAVIEPDDSPTGKVCSGKVCRQANQLELFATGDSPAVEHVASAVGMSYVAFRPLDGRDLLYRALVDEHWGLFAMAPDGTNVRTIVPPTVPAEMDATFASADYSADGERVLFNMYSDDVSNGDPGCCELFSADADGGDVRNFIANDGTGTWDGIPDSSPDGRWIAFWHHLPGLLNQQGIAVVAADGSGDIVMTGPKLPGTAHWIWAPDSSKILMFPDDGSSSTAYLVDPAGGPWTTIPWKTDSDLDWQRLALP